MDQRRGNTGSLATCYLLGTPVEAVVSTGKNELTREENAAYNQQSISHVIAQGNSLKHTNILPW